MSTKLILLFVAVFLACCLLMISTTNALSCYQSNYIGGSFFYSNVSDTSSDSTCSRYKVKCTSSSDTSAEGCSASDISNGVYKTYCILTSSTNCNYIKSQSQYIGQICCKTDFCNDPNSSSASGVVSGQFGKIMIGIVIVGALILL